MSAEIILDLANSTVTAADSLKNLLFALQAQRPVAGSTSALPPNAEDLVAAKRKVHEAARAVMELTGDDEL